MDSLNELFIIGLESMSLTQKLKKLNGGTMVKQVLENINKNSVNRKKIFLYSTHDLTLSAFLIANGIEITKPVEFGSAIIVESYKDDQHDVFIRVKIRSNIKKKKKLKFFLFCLSDGLLERRRRKLHVDKDEKLQGTLSNYKI